MGSRPRRLARWILRRIGTDSEPLVEDLLVLGHLRLHNVFSEV